MCIRINDTCQGINTFFEQSDTDIDKVGLLDPGESYRGMPVIIKDFAVAVSLNYGKVRLYDLKNLTHSRNWQVGGSRSDVTALISAGSLLAAGVSEGEARGKVVLARFPKPNNTTGI